VRRLARLPHSDATRAKLSRAQKGVPKSPEAVEARRRAGGKLHTEEAKEKIRQSRKAQAARSPEEKLADLKREVRAAKKEADMLRIDQWKEDMAVAFELGDMDLWEDIRRSQGWNLGRRVACPQVSDGAFPYQRRPVRILWTTRDARRKSLKEKTAPRSVGA
jgi:hypothetical protein